MLRKLLVALDGSTLAESVLPWAVFLAHEKRMSVTLARVAEGAAQGAQGQRTPTSEAYSDRDAWDAARRYLEAVRARVMQQGLDVEVAVGAGSPAPTLLNLADEVGASVIALTTRSRGGTPDLSHGTVAEQIVQDATVPVLLVPATDAGVVRAPSLRSLLVPLDGSALAERALDIVRDLADPSTSLLLVRVVEPPRRTPEAADGFLPVGDLQETERAVSEAATYLETVRHGAGGDGLPIRTTVSVGEPDCQILAVTHASGCDLIVMVTHGATGPVHWWLGSVAEDVVHHADVPVFLVSARALVARVEHPYRVADVMTRDPVAVRTDETLDVVLHRLLRCRISGAPVVDATGELVGVITEYDLLRWQAGAPGTLAASSPAGAGPGRRSLQTGRAADAMSHLAVSIEESMLLASAVPILLELPYRRLAVTHNGRLTGVLARADVLKAMMEQQEATADVAESVQEAGVGTG